MTRGEGYLADIKRDFKRSYRQNGYGLSPEEVEWLINCVDEYKDVMLTLRILAGGTSKINIGGK